MLMVIRLDIEILVIGKAGTKGNGNGKRVCWCGKRYGGCWFYGPCACLGVFLLL
jgi:hypothetical protein